MCLGQEKIILYLDIWNMASEVYLKNKLVHEIYFIIQKFQNIEQ